ncbi:MAG: hypothetical protein Q7U98_18070 [Methylicorpusculum sp.]|uniref:hypothetical protein n=1 Tax=Methylicorpusculum sp. TaxID=2713644 RepID=UPI00272050E5|nr:hypothetical protein [Methylicorpusculum sp.]MDO8941064.1 hypothetical protein [Methylicorpusculum sp.]MDP2202337.1 hypothetical protein [Methylicorpusculum sp.]
MANPTKMKLTVNIEGVSTFDLELALHEVLKLINEGYLSGNDQNDKGRYQFSIEPPSD